MRAWHRSIISYFAFAGFAWASWVVRLPEIKKLIGVSTSELGLVLLAGSIGALTALILSNRFIERFGTKKSLVGGYTLFTVSLVTAAFCASWHSAILVAVFSLLVGFGVGFADVAQNVDGSQIEQQLGKSIMPRLHAAYSLGTLAGAGYGSLGAWLHFTIEWQTWVMAPVFALLLFLTVRHLPADTGILARTTASIGNGSPESASGNRQPGATAEPARTSALKLLFGSSLFLIGLGIFAITLVEGASNDWLALSIVENYGATPANAGVGYAFLVGAMTITRFFGGNLVDVWGRDVVLRRAALVGVLGILVLIFAPGWFGSGALYVAWIASALWGVGVALAFPLFLSAAGDGKESARRVALVATCGYTAFLVGPPLLGFLGQTIGLLNMFFVLAGCLILAAVIAGALKQSSAEVASYEE
jgi:MFS family permease